MVKVIFPTLRKCSLRKEFAPSGGKLFLLGEVSFLKREVIEENHCLVQYSPFDVRNVISVLATPLNTCS